VDGKTLRGSRHADPDGATRPGRHLLAVIDQCSVADAATDHGTDANPVGPAWCSCP
jgi:hypothetical protein